MGKKIYNRDENGVGVARPIPAPLSFLSGTLLTILLIKKINRDRAKVVNTALLRLGQEICHK